MINNDNSIKLAREKRNISQQELAQRLGIEVSVLNGIELGAKFPSLDNLKKLCSILDIKADKLLSNDSRDPLNLDMLTRKQVTIVRNLYKELKDKEQID